MSMKSALLVSALTAIFAVSGCTATRYITVAPKCVPPAEPVLPAIDRGALWDVLGDQQYRVIERYVDDLWAYADEQAAMLQTLCGGQDE